MSTSIALIPIPGHLRIYCSTFLGSATLMNSLLVKSFAESEQEFVVVALDDLEEVIQKHLALHGSNLGDIHRIHPPTTRLILVMDDHSSSHSLHGGQPFQGSPAESFLIAHPPLMIFFLLLGSPQGTRRSS